jgi:hypothetical protein
MLYSIPQNFILSHTGSADIKNLKTVGLKELRGSMSVAVNVVKLCLTLCMVTDPSDHNIHNMHRFGPLHQWDLKFAFHWCYSCIVYPHSFCSVLL